MKNSMRIAAIALGMAAIAARAGAADVAKPGSLRQGAVTSRAEIERAHLGWGAAVNRLLIMSEVRRFEADFNIPGGGPSPVIRYISELKETYQGLEPGSALRPETLLRIVGSEGERRYMTREFLSSNVMKKAEEFEREAASPKGAIKE